MSSYPEELPAAAKEGVGRASAAVAQPRCPRSPGERLTPGTAKPEKKPAGALETRPDAPAGATVERYERVQAAKRRRAALTVCDLVPRQDVHLVLEALGLLDLNGEFQTLVKHESDWHDMGSAGLKSRVTT